MRPLSGRERALNWAIGIGVLVAFPFLAGGALWLAFAEDDRNDIECSEYEFDQSEWNGDQDDREYEAAGIARCDALDGLSRGEVARLLGDPERKQGEGRWFYATGAFGDLMDGPTQSGLRVIFGPSGAVVRVTETASALPDAGGYVAD